MLGFAQLCPEWEDHGGPWRALGEGQAGVGGGWSAWSQISCDSTPRDSYMFLQPGGRHCPGVTHRTRGKQQGLEAPGLMGSLRMDDLGSRIQI